MAFVLYLLLSYYFVSPMIDLSQAARILARGEFITTDIGMRDDEVGVLGESFNFMSENMKHLSRKQEEYAQALEHRIEEKAKDLANSQNQTVKLNKYIMQSTRYAKMIQRSIMPSIDIFKTNVPDSFAIWIPRDTAGGDIVYADFTKTGIVLAVVDCTGHGATGAFLSIIASSGIRKIVSDEGCCNPAEILKRLNHYVKKSLQQDKTATSSDDGMDVAVCYFSKNDQVVTFAGARQPLFMIDNAELKVINGDRQSIGYRNSELDYNYTNHKINLKKEMCFYLSTNGFANQLGGEDNRMFGKKRLKQILLENHDRPYDLQRLELMRAFYAHKGDNDHLDDVTLIGWSLSKYKQTVILVASIAFTDPDSDNKSKILEPYINSITMDIKNNGGYINKNIDDSILIFFPNKADASVNTSIMMHQRLRELQADNADLANHIAGINTGIYTCTLAVRSFEELEKVSKRDIANEVQLTTLLSRLNIKLGTRALICDTTFSRLKQIENYNYRFIGRVRVLKKREDLAVFEIFDPDLSDVKIKKQKSLEEYDRGIFYYNTKNFYRAAGSFRLVVDLNPHDIVSTMYLERSEYFLHNESPPDWEFIEVLSY